MYCSQCGFNNPETSKYCADCGASLGIEIEVKPSPSVDTEHSPIPPNRARSLGVIPKQRTDWLAFVIIFNYIGMVLLGILTIYVLSFSFFLAVFVALITILMYWLNQGLKIFENTRRIIFLVLLVISTIGSLFDFDIFALIIAGLQFYALVLHAPTVKLFD